MKKEEISSIFQKRLLESFKKQEMNPTVFCRKYKIDRTTFVQLLSSNTHRLPRADTIIQIAQALNVSTDWLLGLSTEQEMGIDILSSAVQKVKTNDAPTAEYLWKKWHLDAKDNKVRTVPVTIPVPLKTERFFIEEYAPIIGNKQAKKEYKKLLDVPGEYEVAFPVQTLMDLRDQTGMFRNFSKETCIKQLEYIAQRNTNLYPVGRFYLFDLTETYVPSFTIFGYSKAAIYLDEKYLVYNAREYVLFLRDIFNNIIRSSVVRPHELTDFIYKDLLQ